MTVPSRTRTWTYIGQGTTGPYAYTSRIFQDADLTVTKTLISTGDVTTLVLGADYTVSGARQFGGGAVTLTSALSSAYSLEIQRTLSILQLLALRGQGPYYPESIEQSFDIACMISQQLADLIDLADAAIVILQTTVTTQTGQIGDLRSDTDSNTTDITQLFTSITEINEAITVINETLVTLQVTDVSLQTQINNLWTAILNGIAVIGIANPMTTQGDMIIGGAAPHAGLPTRLPADVIGKILVQWGSPAVPTWLYLNLADLAAASGNPIHVPVNRVPFVYSSTGAHTHTVSAGVTKVEIEAWGAGAPGKIVGGGTGSVQNFGGGGGAYAWGAFDVDPSDTIALVVGAAGVLPNDGGDSTVNVTDLVAGGGKYGGTGGVASGTITTKRLQNGQAGGVSGAINADASVHGGAGANGGVGGYAFNLTGSGAGTTAAAVPGGGGAAADSGTQTAAAADGLIIVWEYQ